MSYGNTDSAAGLLLRQFRELRDPRRRMPCFHIELVEKSNIFEWEVGFMVTNEDSIYHGAYLTGLLCFPRNFPFSPPTFLFCPPIYHPNVFSNGSLCISILHECGDDTNEEPDSETWSPVQTVETVLISIISLLDDPNVSSPANVDAAVEYKNARQEYNKRVILEVEASKKNMPPGMVYPASAVDPSPTSLQEKTPVEEFWQDVDDDDDGGGLQFESD
ncbi:uncharacterized protein KNAG_0J02280 [Huiozyma naganishii CBS 8797]|uniref:UBC core domain-containing protein n=1 Tax=Huiozyma naganishii (strain ATCC MYA-139 / BCRC 22969 / CBS 8797 / KCTC 17520 / NBRC 10181 / NCYC 3082 / Yp74L-3) TaxID=1071383 RepID=J7S9U8_HUIN7|nr:hypothetical protein KNAG_0J02280 [Kazachstania naganishii CBS 8797]CCK72309.1 hypothetical protein KNAG_0J02280 [Kazachstania naganishii CBS 8797]